MATRMLYSTANVAAAIPGASVTNAASRCALRAIPRASEQQRIVSKGSLFLGAPVAHRQHALSSQSPSRKSAAKSPVIAMTICVGDKLPAGELMYKDKDGNNSKISIQELTAGKKVVLFAVPGAFTPTCSLKHLPGFIENADKFKAKGVSTIGCISVNDVYVMNEWGKSVGADGKVMMLADGGAVYTKALGVDMDKTDKGLGVRSRRYAMVVENGVVKALNLEEGGAFTFSGAESILEKL
eukprot:jgi/Mesvir1/952/Mv17506-RA.1